MTEVKGEEKIGMRDKKDRCSKTDGEMDSEQ